MVPQKKRLKHNDRKTLPNNPTASVMLFPSSMCIVKHGTRNTISVPTHFQAIFRTQLVSQQWKNEHVNESVPQYKLRGPVCVFPFFSFQRRHVDGRNQKSVFLSFILINDKNMQDATKQTVETKSQKLRSHPSLPCQGKRGSRLRQMGVTSMRSCSPALRAGNPSSALCTCGGGGQGSSERNTAEAWGCFVAARLWCAAHCGT